MKQLQTLGEYRGKYLISDEQYSKLKFLKRHRLYDILIDKETYLKWFVSTKWCARIIEINERYRHGYTVELVGGCKRIKLLNKIKQELYTTPEKIEALIKTYFTKKTKVVLNKMYIGRQKSKTQKKMERLLRCREQRAASNLIHLSKASLQKQVNLISQRMHPRMRKIVLSQQKEADVAA